MHALSCQLGLTVQEMEPANDNTMVLEKLRTLFIFFSSLPAAGGGAQFDAGAGAQCLDPSGLLLTHFFDFSHSLPAGESTEFDAGA